MPRVAKKKIPHQQRIADDISVVEVYIDSTRCSWSHQCSTFSPAAATTAAAQKKTHNMHRIVITTPHGVPPEAPSRSTVVEPLAVVIRPTAATKSRQKQKKTQQSGDAVDVTKQQEKRGRKRKTVDASKQHKQHLKNWWAHLRPVDGITDTHHEIAPSPEGNLDGAMSQHGQRYVTTSNGGGGGRDASRVSSSSMGEGCGDLRTLHGFAVDGYNLSRHDWEKREVLYNKLHEQRRMCDALIAMIFAHPSPEEHRALLDGHVDHITEDLAIDYPEAMGGQWKKVLTWVRKTDRLEFKFALIFFALLYQSTFRDKFLSEPMRVADPYNPKIITIDYGIKKVEVSRFSWFVRKRLPQRTTKLQNGGNRGSRCGSMIPPTKHQLLMNYVLGCMMDYTTYAPPSLVPP